jgi:hypothetical protein
MAEACTGSISAVVYMLWACGLHLCVLLQGNWHALYWPACYHTCSYCRNAALLQTALARGVATYM